jgi:hypothetical protein
MTPETLPASLALGALVGLVALVVALALLWALRRSSARPAESDGLITLAGRRFRRRALTANAQIEFLRLTTAAGIEDPDPLPGEQIADYERRLMKVLLEKKLLFPMVACLIVPVEAPKWSLVTASDTAAFIGDLDEPTDQTALWTLVAAALLPFFTSVLSSWSHSLISGTAIQMPRSPSAASSPAIATSAAGGI